MLDKKTIEEELLSNGRSARIFFYETVDSTNTRALEYARANPSEDLETTVFLADSQSGGRGRRGRIFVSKGGEGIFLTLLYRPKREDDLQRITARCAVSFRRAIKASTGVETKIKWVNDLYATTPSGEDKKLCGILAEAAISPEGRVIAVAVGIGVNVFSGAVSEEIKEIATSIEEVSGKLVSREKLCAALIKEFYDDTDENEALSEYRAASLTLNKRVTVLPHCGEIYSGYAEEINDDYSLSIRKENGELVRVFSGEVSTKIEKGHR